jgi:hypothetical protein
MSSVGRVAQDVPVATGETLTLSFAADMPPAVIEVVADDFQTLATAFMRAEQTRQLECDQPARWIRVHLPSGKLMTFPRRQAVQTIDRAMIDPSRREEPSRAKTVAPSYKQRYAALANEVSGATWEESLQAATSTRWEWSLDGGRQVHGQRRWVFSGDSTTPFTLRGRFGKSSVSIRVPGNVHNVTVDDEAASPAAAVTVRMFCRPTVDALLNFMHLSNAERASDTINDVFAEGVPPIRDPFGACVLAYQFLRFRRFDEAANEIFRAATRCNAGDGCVIAAWQLLAQSPERVEEIESHLRTAIGRGAPVYTEGLRLLLDGLLLVGKPEDLKTFRTGLGQVLWTSPVTTLSQHGDSPTRLPDVNVEFPARSPD